MRLERLGLKLLRGAPWNPRMGDVPAIVESLRVHGQYKPLVVGSDGVVVAGNHTWLAMLELGWEDAWVVVLDVPADDEKAVRIALADNRTQDLGQYNDAALLELLDWLGDGFGTGYADNDVEVLRRLVEVDLATPLDLGKVEKGAVSRVEASEAAGTRVLVLEYAPDVYAALTARLALLRETGDMRSNAEVVRRLVMGATP